MSRPIDLTGHRYGRLLVVSEAPKRDELGAALASYERIRSHEGRK